MKLLVFDVEGTLFQTKIRLPGTLIDSTIWQAVAEALGPEAVAAEIATHRKWASGAYPSYLDWMKDTIAIHRRFGLTENVFRSVIAAAEYNPGVAKTLNEIDRSLYLPMLISGGFRELAARVQSDFGIFHAFAACEYLFDRNGSLESYNLLPCDFQGKIDFIELMLREYHLTPESWIFVGDGANDVAIAQRSPVSVGYRPHELLAPFVTHKISNFEELLRILELIYVNR